MREVAGPEFLAPLLIVNVGAGSGCVESAF